MMHKKVSCAPVKRRSVTKVISLSFLPPPSPGHNTTPAFQFLKIPLFYSNICNMRRRFSAFFLEGSLKQALTSYARHSFPNIHYAGHFGRYFKEGFVDCVCTSIWAIREPEQNSLGLFAFFLAASSSFLSLSAVS